MQVIRNLLVFLRAPNCTRTVGHRWGLRSVPSDGLPSRVSRRGNHSSCMQTRPRWGPLPMRGRVTPTARVYSSLLRGVVVATAAGWIARRARPARFASATSLLGGSSTAGTAAAAAFAIIVSCAHEILLFGFCFGSSYKPSSVCGLIAACAPKVEMLELGWNRAMRWGGRGDRDQVGAWWR